MSVITKSKTRTLSVLEFTDHADYVGKWFNLLMMALITVNVIAVILETVEGLSGKYRIYFITFERVSVVVFTAEYILRLWSCNNKSKYSKPISGRLLYALTPMAIVDLLAILPFYLPMLIPFDLRILRALRLLRMLRLLKLGRFSQSIQTFGAVMRAKREELTIALFAVAILLILSSSLMYFIEHEVQPDAFSSIPSTMWWGVVTLTTVGYGDVYPVTSLGKVLGAVIALLGIGLFALPAGILASGFAETLQQRRRDSHLCPHCGGKLPLED